MFNLNYIHNQLVHFPIALFTASVLFDFLGLFLKNTKFYIVSWYTLIVGTISSLLAIASGFIEDRAYGHMAHPFPIHETHGSVQIIGSTLFMILLIWRYKKKIADSQPPFPYLILSITALFILLYGAHLGAKMAGLT